MQAQLSGIDASFLYLEDKTNPINIGGIFLFENNPNNPMTIKRLRRHVAKRVYNHKGLHHKIKAKAFGLGKPEWEVAKDIDINFHIQPHFDEGAVEEEDLMALGGEFFNQVLDRSRPLWKTLFVPLVNRKPSAQLPTQGGTNKNTTTWAMLTVVHHSVIDGIGGTDIMAALLDFDVNGFTSQEKEAPADNNVEQDLQSTPNSPIKETVEELRALPAAGFKFASTFAKQQIKGELHRLKNRKQNLPRFLRTAPQTKLNRSFSGERKFNAMQFPMAQMQAVKSAIDGARLNDIVLSQVAGALRIYMKANNDLPSKDLICFAPIATQPHATQQEMGNNVSGMLINLATSQSDVYDRTLQIIENRKAARALADTARPDSIVENIPFPMGQLAGKAYNTLKLNRLHSPFFNMLVTNVPGPQFPLYLESSPMVGAYPTAPIANGMGLSFTILSYNGFVNFGITACKSAMPDLDLFMGCLKLSLAEMESDLIMRGLLSEEDLRTHKATVASIAPASSSEESDAGITKLHGKSKSA